MTNERIPRMQGAQEATFQAEADLASTTVRQAWSRPPIQVDFSGELQSGILPQDSLLSGWMIIENSRHVHCIWTACTILEGFREEQLPIGEMGTIYDQSEWYLPDQSE